MLSGTVSVAGRTAKWAFTSRHGGRSPSPYATNNMAGHVGDDGAHVRANRAQLEHSFAAGPLSWMGPVHGVDLAVIQSAVAITPNVDALGTMTANTPLVTLGADCVPVLVVARDFVIAAHVGWRGLVDGMTERIATRLAAEGVDVVGATVLLGPGICGGCYGIPSERAALVEAACAQALVTAANGGPGADIRKGLSAQWQGRGARVEVIGPCTFESPDHFSHRRDGTTGRQAGVIAWLS